MRVARAVDTIAVRRLRSSVNRVKRWDKMTLRLLALAVVVGIMVSAALLANTFGSPSARTVGYPVIFLVNFLGSGGFVLPLPGLAFTAWGGYSLNPPLVALVAGTAETLGEVSGYLLGYSGRGLVEKIPLFKRMEATVSAWLRRWGWLSILAFAAIPNPVFDVLGIAAGSMRYPFWKFLVVVWAGKLAKTLEVAYLGAQGVQWLLDF